MEGFTERDFSFPEDGTPIYFCSTDTASHMEIRSRGSCRFPSVKNVQQHDCVNGQAYSGDVKLMRIHIWKGNS